MSKHRNAPAASQSRLLNQITRQVARMDDATVYSLTFAADRLTRRVATEIAHKRAEAFAIETEARTAR